jgi:hypothetical protein
MDDKVLAIWKNGRDPLGVHLKRDKSRKAALQLVPLNSGKDEGRGGGGCAGGGSAGGGSAGGGSAGGGSGGGGSGGGGNLRGHEFASALNTIITRLTQPSPRVGLSRP